VCCPLCVDDLRKIMNNLKFVIIGAISASFDNQRITDTDICIFVCIVVSL
jgi:hypothetical protein